jgi:hypothetical protein
MLSEGQQVKSRTSLDLGHRRTHVVINWAGKIDSDLVPGWYLQRAWPTAHGYRLDYPHAGPFMAKREAALAKKRGKERLNND